MAELSEERDDSDVAPAETSSHTPSELRRQQPRHTNGAQAAATRTPTSRRLCLTGEEILLVQNLLVETKFWKHTRNRQIKIFKDMVERIKTDTQIPFRDSSRRSFTCDKIKSLVKTCPDSLPRSVKNSITSAKSLRLRITVRVTKSEKTVYPIPNNQFRTLLLSEKIVANLSQTISSSDASVQTVQASAAA